MKVGLTPSVSLATAFDAFLAAARRRGIDAQLVETGRTLIAEFAETDFLEPFVGTHRVQRIPRGSSARHTSTATLAILDDSEAEVDLNEDDLSERFTRGSGNGGQNRNVHDNCVVLSHIPTGIEVRIDGRSQWENRQQARRELARRLREAAEDSQAAEHNAQRVSQINPERSAKSFTWNTQHGTVIDHATGRKWPLKAFAKGRF